MKLKLNGKMLQEDPLRNVIEEHPDRYIGLKLLSKFQLKWYRIRCKSSILSDGVKTGKSHKPGSPLLPPGKIASCHRMRMTVVCVRDQYPKAISEWGKNTPSGPLLPLLGRRIEDDSIRHPFSDGRLSGGSVLPGRPSLPLHSLSATTGEGPTRGFWVLSIFVVLDFLALAFAAFRWGGGPCGGILSVGLEFCGDLTPLQLLKF
nr:hypothetical protein Iba_chr02aCG20850 [Ipomoea batatas]